MTIRNICIYGAGALGGTFATKIANGLGEQANVSIVARGAHLAAIRDKGLTVEQGGDAAPLHARVTATSDPSELPKQDLIITGLKGHQLGDAAEGLASLLKERTRVIMILNGIPWWYFHRDSGSGHAERQLPELDPEGKLWRLVGPERVIGCVAYQGAEVTEPGTIRLNGDGRFFLGEPSGELSPDLVSISELLGRAGLNIIPTPRIRDEIWTKLMGNAAYNPISALTRGRMNSIMENAALVAQVGKVMAETKGRRRGAWRGLQPKPRRTAWPVGRFRPGQDLDAAGPACRKGAGDRSADRHGGGAWQARRRADPDLRNNAGADAAARPRKPQKLIQVFLNGNPQMPASA
jgi:2-dehydropantoate 2-reductase